MEDSNNLTVSDNHCRSSLFCTASQEIEKSEDDFRVEDAPNEPSSHFVEVVQNLTDTGTVKTEFMTSQCSVSQEIAS